LIKGDCNKAANPSTSVNICVTGLGFVGWGGGLDFIRLILDGLTYLPSQPPIPLLLPRKSAKTVLRDIARNAWQAVQSARRGQRPKIAASSLPVPDLLADYFADYGADIRLGFYSDSRSGLLRLAASENATVLLPVCGTLGRDFPLPWVGYVYDFQHKHLPQYFTASERKRRDIWFESVLSDAPLVLVNAATVRDDVARYFPQFVSKVRVLPFAPCLRPEWLDLDAAAAREALQLEEGYFMVCNQFWLHKDHATALRGFAKYIERTGETGRLLVCTGEMHDPRQPDYANKLRCICEDLGISHRVRFLGRLPKSEQIALLRDADALIQPTLFEGGPGGGASYDAIAVGTPVIASDIPVNREMDCGDLRFFQAGSGDALGRLLAEHVARNPVRPTALELQTQTAVRLSLLGSALTKVAEEACRIYRRGSAPTSGDVKASPGL